MISYWSVGLGFSGAAAKAAEVAAITWAGSQVTKIPRAAAALVLAPLVDHLLNFIQGTRPATFRPLVRSCQYSRSLSLDYLDDVSRLGLNDEAN